MRKIALLNVSPLFAAGYAGHHFYPKHFHQDYGITEAWDDAARGLAQSRRAPSA
jgi:hypothetical protein